MWIRREFLWRDSEDTGLVGWTYDRGPGFEPASGFGLAHDVLEHFTLDGTVEDEAQAYGAILWGRGQSGYWSNKLTQNFGNVMYHDALQEFSRHQGIRTPGRVAPLAEEDLEAEVLLLRSNMLRHWSSDYGWNLTHSEEQRLELSKIFCDWVRVGYRRAQRRWGRHMDYWQFMHMFNLIETDRLCRHGYKPESENDKLVISVSPKLREVRIVLDGYRYQYE